MPTTLVGQAEPVVWPPCGPPVYDHPRVVYRDPRVVFDDPRVVYRDPRFVDGGHRRAQSVAVRSLDELPAEGSTTLGWS
jgi:hypothetical protein